MIEEKLFVLMASGLVLFGCQSLEVTDIESLPPPAVIPETSEQGAVEVRYFNGISGNSITDVTGLARFPDNPDEVA